MESSGGLSSFPQCSAVCSSLEDLCHSTADFCLGAEALPPSNTDSPPATTLQDDAGNPGACWELQQDHVSSRTDLTLCRADVPDGGGGASSHLSLAERVEMNRQIVKQMLDGTQRRPISSQLRRKEGVAQGRDGGSVLLTGGELDSGIPLHGEPNRRLCAADPVLGCGHQTTRRAERARMKARSSPLKADHSLLGLHTHTPSGLRPTQQADLRGRDGLASLSGNLSDSSSGESACGPPWRRQAPSPTRVRFEDETEKEAESRYLERQRQRRRAGERAQGLLVSKPDPSVYIRKEVGPPGAGGTPLEEGCFPNRQQRAARLQHCESCATVLEGGVSSLNLHPRPPPLDREGWGLDRPAPDRPHLMLRTERIKETYIGSISPNEGGTGGSRGGGTEGGAGRVPVMRVRRRTNQAVLTSAKGQPGTFPLDIPQATPPSTANGAAEPPLNPYTALLTQAPPTATSSPSSPPPPRKPKPSSCSRARPNGTRGDRPLNRSPNTQQASTLQKELRPSDHPAESQAPPTNSCSPDGQMQEPMTAEQQREARLTPEDGRSRLSLRKIFSAVGLNRTRTGSLDRLSSRPRPSSPGPTSPDLRKPSASSNLLRKTPSLQSLSTQGSPFLQLRKSSSFQNFQSEKSERSAAYQPATRTLQRALSVEDVGRPSFVRPVGKVSQVFSDGTFLLQLNRPPSGTFGFHISRGRGRPDSGVYVEDMVDSSTEKLYAGLLGAGDEIVEVNGEKVAGLSLDLVTHLLTQTSSASVRILRHRKLPPH